MTTESPRPEVQTDAPEPEPVLTLIKQIRDSRLDPCILSAEDRQRCVEVLWSEGYGVPETAQILRRSDRTIARDRAELRSMHALRVHPQFAPQMAGELIRHAESSITRLRKIARESAASAMERLMAEQSAFKVHVDMIGKLQSLGFLPRIPTNVVAHVIGAGADDAIATCDQLVDRLRELEAVDNELGVTDPQRQQQRQTLMAMVQRGRLAAEVDALFHQPPSEN